MTPACIVGIRGYSDSGKTTLIEKALPELKREGLSVGVLKHAHHGLEADPAEKDTARFFDAGADFILAHDPAQGLLRSRNGYRDIYEALSSFPPGLDLILVEGHKQVDIPHIWLDTDSHRDVEDKETAGINLIDRTDPDYVSKFLDFVHSELSRQQALRKLRAGLLIGGKSGRMGRPKHLLQINGETLVEKSYCVLSSVAEQTLLLGSADLPESLKSSVRLPDVPYAQGPMAGMLSAFRWEPSSAWIISSVDMPLMSAEAWRWLLSQRRPGVWAVLPRIDESSPAETTGACYEPMIFGEFEAMLRKREFKLQNIVSHPKVITPVIPAHLAQAWKNVNTEEEWHKVKGLM